MRHRLANAWENTMYRWTSLYTAGVVSVILALQVYGNTRGC